MFRMGSTVVIIFEVPLDRTFFFRIKNGDKVKVGEEIGFIM